MVNALYVLVIAVTLATAGLLLIVIGSGHLNPCNF
jgi:hypothetical protein